MLRFAWATALATLLVLAVRLTVFDSNRQSTSCEELELRFESADFSESLPAGPALIIGNQRVRYWTNPLEPIRGGEVIRRSAQGLNPDRIYQCFPRLVGYYQPSAVVIPLDTSFASDIDQSALFKSLDGIVDQRSEYSLDFDLWVIAPITTPRFERASTSALEAVNAAGAAWASNKFKVRWLNFQANFTDEAGKADSKLVWPDGNTLNDKGYERLTEALVTISNERK